MTPGPDNRSESERSDPSSHPALAALSAGRIDDLADFYDGGATLDLSVPGRREVACGTAAGALLKNVFRERVAGQDLEIKAYPDGAAVTLTRSPWRQRHYIHWRGERVTGHWVYAAGIAPVANGNVLAPTELLDAIGAGSTLEGAVGGGNSGASLVRARTAEGSRVVAKRVSDGGDWLSRALGGGTRSADLWRCGAFAELPSGMETGIRDVVEIGSASWIVMEDVADSLIEAEHVLTRSESRRVLDLAALMHERFAGVDLPAASFAARLAATGPLTASRERDGHDLPPKQLPAAWDAFESSVGAPLGTAVRRLTDDPAPLVAALSAPGTTLIHGDLRDDNLALRDDGTVVALDWDLATTGVPAVEFAWYLAQDSWRIDATREEIVADFQAPGGAWRTDRMVDLGLAAGLVMYGWIFAHSALVHPDPDERSWGRAELDWWVPRASQALERLGLLRSF